MTRLCKLLGGTALAASLLAGPAQADQQTVKLIQLLIQKGILSKGQASDLLRETVAPAPVRGTRGHAAPSPELESEAPAAPAKGEIRVTYVPDFVRKQIADQVRASVMTEAEQEGWATPNTLPEWTQRLRVYGDLRFRNEGDLQNGHNYNQFVNFQALNAGSPFDINGYALGTAAPPPFLNTTQDRDRFRIRARIGVQAMIADWITSDIVVATGSDNGPVTPNQTLGTPGDFGKGQIYLDRAYFTLKPIKSLNFYLGREEDPFFATDLMFYRYLGFDGISGRYAPYVGGGVTPFLTAGAFPILNTAFDFSTFSQTKFPSRDAYLFAAQAGAEWRITPLYTTKLGVGIFDYDDVQGSVSAPCNISTGGGYYCNSDNTRPSFLQGGNTLYAIRDIIPPPTSGTAPANPQYFGLASRFNVFDAHGTFDIHTYDPITIELEGDYLKNLAYNRTEILGHGPSNGPIGPQNNLGNNGAYVGGDTAYMFKASLGELEIHKLWDWNVSLAYKYLESDATLDSINDPDFHLGGTNAKGYILAAALGVARDTFVSLRWLSATQVSGPQYQNDVVQLDLQSSF